jgi:uncharacterized membrane protein
LIELTIGKNKVELPVLVIPGMNADTIAVAVVMAEMMQWVLQQQGLVKMLMPGHLLTEQR